MEQKKDRFLPISILIAAAIIGGAVVFSATRGGAAPSAAQNNQAAGTATAGGQASVPPIGASEAVLGNANAPVSFIEYGDYQCPFCGRLFTQVEPQLRSEYIKTGEVKMVYRNFQFLGAESMNAAAAAYCAKDQGKFWEYHDALYNAKVKDSANGENDGFFNRSEFLELARNVGLDVNAFTSCLDNNKYVEQVKKDTAAAQAIGVNSTPTNYVNGQPVQGAQPYAAFKTVIDAALTKQ